MTLDGKIATARGESKWITGEPARAEGMKLRAGADAILVGVNTVLADDPSLTVRRVAGPSGRRRAPQRRVPQTGGRQVQRIVLDSRARTPPSARVVCDADAGLTTVVVGRGAPARRVAALQRRVRVWIAPSRRGRIDVRWLLKRLGSEGVTRLLVEGGGEVNASFLLGRLAHRVVFFYAPKILGGRKALKAVAGDGARSLRESLRLWDIVWSRVGDDLMMTARCDSVSERVRE
jgi:diaminohydroxyphosphoribosylaminopyrimidine deaminase/5-amino-6-(5-phosphoribosylamino)uracil reductase